MKAFRTQHSFRNLSLNSLFSFDGILCKLVWIFVFSVFNATAAERVVLSTGYSEGTSVNSSLFTTEAALCYQPLTHYAASSSPEMEVYSVYVPSGNPDSDPSYLVSNGFDPSEWFACVAYIRTKQNDWSAWRPYGYGWRYYQYVCPTSQAGIYKIAKKATICENFPSSTLIGYFNGVANTETSALLSLKRLKLEYGTTYKTKPLDYNLFYNQTTCELGAFLAGKIPCLEDIAEVFQQRSSELNRRLKNRWEHFWEMLSGRTSQDGSLTATLTSKLGKFGEAILQMLDSIYALVINQFVGSFFSFLNSLSGTPTLADNARQVLKLKTYADNGSGMVLIAHSQGNLYVNMAYDDIKTVAPTAKVKVVHVAPASPTLRGNYALADVDFVIRSLRQLVSGLPSVNIELPLSANDRTGHAFEGTYLDVSRKAYERVKTMINTALDGV